MRSNSLTLLFFFLLLTFAIAKDQCQISQDCSSTDYCFKGKCLPKEPFPLNSPEIFGIILVLLLTGLSNAGGVGGGPLLSSILIIALNYNENKAFAIVSALVFGGSVGNFLNVLTQRDPSGKPLINYNLALICVPPILLGTMLGILLSRILAPIILSAGVVLTSLFMILRIYGKARQQYQEETEHKIKQMEFHTNKKVEEIRLNKPQVSLEIEENSSPTYPQEAQKTFRQEHKLFPKRKLTLIAMLIITILFMTLIRGSKKFDSILGVSYCGFTYWGLFITTAFICLAFMILNQIFVRKILQRLNHTRQQEGSFQLCLQHLPKLRISSGVVGFLAGLLGIGSGMIISPTLLQIGVPARNLAATAGFFVVQTSFISLFQSAFSQDVPLETLGFFLILATISSFLISAGLTLFINKFKRPSVILVILIVIIGLSVVIVPISTIIKAQQNWKQIFTFKSIC